MTMTFYLSPDQIGVERKKLGVINWALDKIEISIDSVHWLDARTEPTDATQTNKQREHKMTKLIKKRKLVLSAFLEMGGTPRQMLIEQIKTLSPAYVQGWLETIHN